SFHATPPNLSVPAALAALSVSTMSSVSQSRVPESRLNLKLSSHRCPRPARHFRHLGDLQRLHGPVAPTRPPMGRSQLSFAQESTGAPSGAGARWPSPAGPF